MEHQDRYVQCGRRYSGITTALLASSGYWRCLSAAAALLFLLVCFWSGDARAEDPAADKFAAGNSSQAADRHLDQIILLEEKILKARPNDAEAYFNLADAYVRKGRQTGDVTYFNLANDALRKALEIQPRLVPAMRELAFVLYALHDFSEAAEQAQRAINLDPIDSYAYGVLGDADLETGHYPEAQRAYDTMVELRRDLYSYCRRAGLKSVRGDAAGAVADLNYAIRNGIQTMEPRESLAWAEWQLGNEYFLLGRIEEAENWYQGSLKTYPNYYRGLAGLAQVRAAQGKLGEAANMYQQAIAVIPLPEYAAALGDVYTVMGCIGDAHHQRDLVEFIAKLNGLNRILYNRVLVYYYADHDIHVDQAVALATEELKVRQDIYGHDAIAWALYKKGKPQAALPHVAKALALKTQDSKLYYHAGLIYLALGRKSQARASLAKALELNPHFQPVQDEICARDYAALGGEPSKYAAAASGRR